MELLPDLSSEENSVFKQLSHELIHIDELCNQMKKDTPEVLSTLLLLELINLVKQHPGKLFIQSVLLVAFLYVIYLILTMYCKTVSLQP